MQKKVLVLVSNPKGTANLELLPEIKKLKESFRRSRLQDRFEVFWEVMTEQSDLRRYILETRPHIVHFCGHGTEQGLVLGDRTTTVATNELIADLLKAFADRIECVVLNACDSEPLADHLVQHLNYVVGMNQEVRDDAAISFAEGFYDALGAGESYEKAFEIGKTAVLGQATSRYAPNRKLTVVTEDDEPVIDQIPEHLIPVLKVNPHPTPIQPFWLAPEVERQAVQELLQAIANSFNTIKLFHTDEAIVLKDQYIPVQVTLERRYNHVVEAIGGYAESEAELRRIYAMKGSSEDEISEEKIEEKIKRQQIDWEEARREHSRLVVLADPGMGKTTLLRREVVTSVQQAQQALAEDQPVNDIVVPLLIRLSSLADEVEAMPAGEAMLKIIQERHSTLLKHHENPEVVAFLNGFLQQQLLKGKALLLLDALDEVPDGKRQKLLEKLNEFAKDTQTWPCAIVGTSRIMGYGGRLVEGAKDVEIVPFTQKQTEQYIETWFTNAQKSLKDQSISTRDLIKALRERPQLAGLAQNPLLLSLICSLYQQDYLTLPVRRCELYEQAVNYMLEQWSTDNERQRANEGWILAKKELLEELAYQFSCEGKQLFSFGELRKKLEKYLKSGNVSTDLEGAKAADLIKELCEQDGILQRWTAEDDRISIERRRYLFLHRTFQEYLTASYLSRVDADEIEFKRLFWNYDWHETISLMAGLMNDPIDLIQRITNTKDDIFQTQLLLAGRCLAECRELSHPLVDEIIDRIYQFWLAYPNTEFIRSVVVAIGQTTDNLVQRLQTSLNDNARDVRGEALETLGQIGTDRATDVLIAMRNDEDDFIRWGVAAALRQIGTDRARDALIAMRNDENPQVRFEAMRAFEQIGTDRTSVRRKAARALGQIRSDRAIEALIAALNDEDSKVRRKAAVALGQIRSDRATDMLIAALSNEDSFVRRNVAEALGQIGTDKARDALIVVLNDEDSSVRRKAARALGQIGTSKVIEALIAALNDEDSNVRRNAAAALGQIGFDRAVDTLITALNDEDSFVRWETTKALGQIGSDRATDSLIVALNDEDSFVRGNAAAALGRIGPDRATDALTAALNDQANFPRENAAAALGLIGTDRATDALIAALNHEASDVRGNAAAALGQIGTNKAIDALITTLNHEDWNDRWCAADALRQIGSPVCLEKLLQTGDRNLIKRADVFPLARSWAIRFSQKGLPFIPVYPEVISAMSTMNRAEESEQ